MNLSNDGRPLSRNDGIARMMDDRFARKVATLDVLCHNEHGV